MVNAFSSYARSLNPLSSVAVRKLVLQKLVRTKGIYGDVVESWVNEKTLRGYIETVGGRTQWLWVQNHPQELASNETRVRINYREGISTAENRIVHGKVVYDIIGVMQSVDRVETQLTLTARSVIQPDGGLINV